MIAAPWYLLAGGTVLVILGYLVEGLSGPPRKPQRVIHHRMRDEDIIKSLNEPETISTGAAIAFFGYVLVGISILWRLLRYFL